MDNLLARIEAYPLQAVAAAFVLGAYLGFQRRPIRSAIVELAPVVFGLTRDLAARQLARYRPAVAAPA